MLFRSLLIVGSRICVGLLLALVAFRADCADLQFSADRTRVFATRVGGGQDREIRLDVRKVAVGETFRADGYAKGVKTRFACYDGDTVTFKPDPNNRWGSLIEYKNEFAEISADGVVTAKKPGPVVVLAMDGAWNKRITSFEVVPAV